MQIKGSTYAIFDTHHLATFFHKQQARGGSRGSLHLLGTSFEPSFFFFFLQMIVCYFAGLLQEIGRDWLKFLSVMKRLRDNS